MLKKYWPIVSLTLFLPFATAAVSHTTDGVGKFLGLVKGWIDTLIPILIGIALIYFIWSSITLITVDNSEKREEAKKGMFWGVIALFVIVSIWGITKFVRDIFGIDENSVKTVVIPQVPNTTTTP